MWVERNGSFTPPPINLHPELGASLLRHPRIGGWCDFFETKFTREVAEIVRETCPYGTLPEPSLDGLMWYVSERMGRKIVKVKMKDRGWTFRHSMSSIAAETERAMQA